MSKKILHGMRRLLSSKDEANNTAIADDVEILESAPSQEDAIITVEDQPLNALKSFMQQEDDIHISPKLQLAEQPEAAHLGQGYLTGQLLVATPQIDTGCFQRSVVYIFAHSAQGAMGVIINQPIEEVGFDTLIEGIPAPNTDIHDGLPVYFGGPVNRHRGFVVHSADYISEQTLARHGDIAITASTRILQDMLAGKGPENAYLAIGVAGWSAGQLEQEIEQNSWISVPATADLLFHTEDELKWGKACQSLGIDMHFFSPTAGHC